MARRQEGHRDEFVELRTKVELHMASTDKKFESIQQTMKSMEDKMVCAVHSERLNEFEKRLNDDSEAIEKNREELRGMTWQIIGVGVTVVFSILGTVYSILSLVTGANK